MNDEIRLKLPRGACEYAMRNKKLRTDIYAHNQFKSPLDGSWQDIKCDEVETTLAFWIATHETNEGSYISIERLTKRGLINTLHRMNIQTRKGK